MLVPSFPGELCHFTENLVRTVTLTAHVLHYHLTEKLKGGPLSLLSSASP